MEEDEEDEVVERNKRNAFNRAIRTDVRNSSVAAAKQSQQSQQSREKLCTGQANSHPVGPKCAKSIDVNADRRRIARMIEFRKNPPALHWCRLDCLGSMGP